MIFQAPIPLVLKDRDVQAIIDFDTGQIGFTERIAGNDIEYTYQESPVAFKQALFQQLAPILAKNSLGNFKISRKNQTKR